VLPRYDIDRIDNRDPAVLDTFVSAIEPLLRTWFRPVVRGLDRVPDGAALYVANHNGGLVTADTFIFGAALYRALGLDGVPYGLAHEVILQAPGIHQLLVPLGAVRASPKNARALFDAGKKVLVYPGGDIDAMRPFAQRDRIVFGLRRGYIRLALRTGVPIVPVVAAGAHATSLVLSDGRRLAQLLDLPRRFRLEVCPVTLSVPWGLVVGITPPYLPFPTRIFMEVMEPVRFERTGEAAANDAEYVEHCHRRVHGEMEARLARLAAERRATRFGRAAWASAMPATVERQTTPTRRGTPSVRPRAAAMADVVAPLP
jgi:1-acyl-sn-glycerol-3-phosphate acyltransferase